MEDWRSRAWYHIQALGKLVGEDDPEVRRRERMFSAIDTFSQPEQKEAQFAHLELCTRTQGEMLHFMLQVPHVRDHVLGDAPKKPAASPAKASEPAAAADPPPAAEPAEPAAPSAPPEPRFAFTSLKSRKSKNKKKKESPAKLYSQATASWNEFLVNEAKMTVEARASAREAVKVVRDVVAKLSKQGAPQLGALLAVIGLTEDEIAQGDLEKRIR